MSDSMHYFTALVDELGGPNGRMTNGSYLLHDTVSFWNQEKIDYLRSINGLDWELRDANGSTALLRGYSSGDEHTSGFKRTSQMIDYGADPHAVDRFGKGICEYVRNGSRVEKRVFASEYSSLVKRLKDEFQIDCLDPSIP